MNYGKLTLAVTAGILLAVAIIVAIIAIPEFERQKRIRARYLAAAGACHGDGCPEGAYARAVKSLAGDVDKIPAAAVAFCTDTAWQGASEDRKAGLIAQCELETSRHLAEDIK